MCGTVLPQELRFRIQSKDKLPAQVQVQGQDLGTTGEDLLFDISGYAEPVYLDVVLSRPGAVSTLHSLKMEPVQGTWEPEPLGLCQAVNPIRLNSEPQAKKIYREKKDGSLVPSGEDGTLMLSVGPLPPKQPFVPQSVVVVLETPGYQQKRLVLPASVWLARSFPEPEQAAIELEPSYGLGAWWTRTGSQNLGLLLALSALGLTLLGTIRLRFHYLKQIESNHRDLNTWVARLNTFVEGSRDMASPLKVEELASQAQIQARRLTRSDWEWIEFVNPDFRALEQEVSESVVQSLSDHLSQHLDRPLHLDRVQGSLFTDMSQMAASVLAIPLRFRDEYRGFVLVGSEQDHAFTETDREALGVLCHQLSATVERLRLHQETVEAYKQLAESEAQLIESAKMAAVGQLAAGVAHELNSPLNAINLGIQMAERNLSDNPAIAQKRLGLATAATKKASDIVSKLLYYSREGLKEDQEISVESLWDDALALVNLQLSQDEISVTRKGRVEETVMGNQTELTQVLTYLLMNARDALLKCPDAPREITTESKRTERDIELSVSDFGGGVDPEIASRIFEPFFTTKNMGGDGTGLSLSVSQKIAERQGGRLKLESLQQPTTFTLILSLNQKPDSK